MIFHDFSMPKNRKTRNKIKIKKKKSQQNYKNAKYEFAVTKYRQINR